MASIEVKTENDIFTIIVMGQCEPGSEGNYIGDLIDEVIERSLSNQITQIVLDLTQADYNWGDYFLSLELSFALSNNRSLTVLSKNDNFKSIKSLFSIWEGADFDIQISNQDA